MNEAPAASPRWAARLHELLPQSVRSSTARDRSEAWQIVYFNISRYLRYHATRLGSATLDDISDIAAQKTLDLMGKVDTSTGRLLELAPHEMPGFLSTVAHNGLVSFLKKARRQETVDEDSPRHERFATRSMDPQAHAESMEYARALRGCVEKLVPRWREVWFYRIFYDMSSRDIAAHPSVNMSASQIDVGLHRARKAVRDCMNTRGHDTRVMPPGTFVMLWRMFHPVEASKSNKEAV